MKQVRVYLAEDHAVGAARELEAAEVVVDAQQLARGGYERVAAGPVGAHQGAVDVEQPCDSRDAVGRRVVLPE